jgi:uracil-DNA glycosylase family 4
VSDSIARIAEEVIRCERCPRLAAYIREVGERKRRAYRDQQYWARPVPGFGDPNARLLIVGLAPGAHGANRTGRMFTGDRSGDFLYRALYETGFASQAASFSQDDGLTLRDCYISAAARCAPPQNKPSREELAACRIYLQREIAALDRLRAVVVLGRIALDAYRAARGLGPLAFGHGILHPLDPVVIASYHPSQQNTQTGRLTAAMLREVFERARNIIETDARSRDSFTARLG